MQKITTEQDIRYIIENDIKYIDKTAIVHDLIIENRSIFFSRPRRFGKSMLISTLYEIFSGNKKLFRNLYIGKNDYNFEEFPIIKISFANFDVKYNENIYKYLDRNIYISYKGSRYNIKDFGYKSSSDVLFSLGDLAINISDFFNKQVVLLVDEYDKIATANFNDQKNIKKYVSILSGLYSGIKDASGNGYMKFTFISGLTKILSNDLFSTLNHLNDISNDYKYFDIAGYTKKEILDNFGNDYLDLLSKKNGRSIDDEMLVIKDFYNGYNFGLDESLIYNPYSINLLFQKQRYDLYWANTGRAQLVVNYIENIQQDEYINTIEDIRSGNILAQNKDIFILEKGRVNLIGLLYQVGYLTIKDGYYTIPNKEAEYCLIEDFTSIALNYNTELLNLFANSGKNISDGLFNMNYKLIDRGVEGLEKMLLNINPKWYQNNPEGQLKGYLYNTLLISGLSQYRQLSQEEITNNGYSDITIKDNKLNTCIVIEAKGSEPLKNALQQVRDQYIDYYINQGYNIILFGIKWDSKSHKITYTIDKP